MVEFLSDLLFNKILVALVLAYPVAAVLFFQRLRREDEQENQRRHASLDIRAASPSDTQIRERIGSPT